MSAAPTTQPSEGIAPPARWRDIPWRLRDPKEIIAAILVADPSQDTYAVAAEAGLSVQDWMDFLAAHGRELWEARLRRMGHAPPADLGPSRRGRT